MFNYQVFFKANLTVSVSKSQSGEGDFSGIAELCAPIGSSKITANLPRRHDGEEVGQ